MQTCTGCKIIFTCRTIGIEKVGFGRFREFRQFLTPKNDPKNGLFLTPEKREKRPQNSARFLAEKSQIFKASKTPSGRVELSL